MLDKSQTSIRLATPDDLATCLAFEELDEFGIRTKLDNAILLGSINAGAIFLAELNGVAIGYASLNFLYASRQPLLSWWFVDANHRGQKHGSLLLQAVKERLAGLGFHNVLISACRPHEISRHRASGLREIGSLDLGENQLEYFFVAPLQ